MKNDMDFNESRLDAAEINLTSSNKFLKWLDNFWYHNKWKVIIIAFFAIVVVVGVVQMVNKEEYDCDITVATHTIYYRENIDAIERDLVSLMPRDMNRDGKKNILLRTYKIYSEGEMNEANSAETDENGNPVIYADKSFNSSQYQEFKSYINTGECSIVLISEYLYLEYREADRIMPLSNIFGADIPNGAMTDGYGVMLKDTYAYEYFEGLKTLPEDTIICMLRPYVWGASSNEQKYDMAKEYFKSIVGFSQ